MTDADRLPFAKLMALLQEVFVPSRPISKEKTAVYFDILKKYDFEKINGACKELVKSKKYATFPLPAEILEYIEPRHEEMVEVRALEAWQHACSRYDGRPGGKDDPLLDEAIRIAFGGWNQFGQTNPDYEAQDRRHFIECFRHLAHREQYHGQLGAAEPKYLESAEEDDV